MGRRCCVRNLQYFQYFRLFVIFLILYFFGFLRFCKMASRCWFHRTLVYVPCKSNVAASALVITALMHL